MSPTSSADRGHVDLLVPSEGAGNHSISDHDADRHFDGRHLGAAKDSIVLTAVMLEQACYGQWAIRVRSDIDEARRCSSFSLHEPSAGSEPPCKSICTLSGSALGDGLDCISEGAGHNHHKAQRAFVRSKPGFYSWLRARGC